MAIPPPPNNNGVVSLSLLLNINFLLSIFVSYSRMSASICWDHWLHWKCFTEKSYYLYISLWPLSDRLCCVTSSSNFILVQWRRITSTVFIIVFVFFLSFLLVDEYNHLLGSLITSEVFLRSDHIFAIYHYFIHDPFRVNCMVSQYLVI